MSRTRLILPQWEFGTTIKSLFGDCYARMQGHFFDLAGAAPKNRRLFVLVYRKIFGFNKPNNLTSRLEAHFPSGSES
jgi:hypothetical protein